MTEGAQTAKSSNSMSNFGIIFGAISALFLPIIFGPAAIVMASIAKSKAEPNSNLALGISIGGTIVGFPLGVVTAVF